MENSIVSRGILFSSVITAFFLDIACIAVYLFPSNDGVTRTGGVLTLMYFFSILFLLVLSVINRSFKLKRNVFLIVSIIIAFYIYSKSVYPAPFTNPAFFYLFTIVSFIIPSITTINVKIFLRAMMLFSVPAIARIGLIFHPLAANDATLSMGYSYSFLTPIVGAIVYFVYYFKYDRGFSKFIFGVAIVCNLILAYFIVVYGSRGPVVSLLTLFLLPTLLNLDQNGNGIAVKKKKLLLFCALFVVIMLFFVPILSFLQVQLHNFGLDYNFIDKFIERDYEGDISSNRGLLLDLAFRGFLERPFFGNGFDQFVNNTVWPYPHNFITQILYDGGLFLFCIILVPVFLSLRDWRLNCTFNEFLIITTLLFASVPGCLFSGDLWQSCSLWVFFGACLNFTTFANKTEYYER